MDPLHNSEKQGTRDISINLQSADLMQVNEHCNVTVETTDVMDDNSMKLPTEHDEVTNDTTADGNNKFGIESAEMTKDVEDNSSNRQSSEFTCATDAETLGNNSECNTENTTVYYIVNEGTELDQLLNPKMSGSNLNATTYVINTDSTETSDSPMEIVIPNGITSPMKIVIPKRNASATPVKIVIPKRNVPSTAKVKTKPNKHKTLNIARHMTDDAAPIKTGECSAKPTEVSAQHGEHREGANPGSGDSCVMASNTFKDSASESTVKETKKEHKELPTTEEMIQPEHIKSEITDESTLTAPQITPMRHKMQTRSHKVKAIKTETSSEDQKVPEKESVNYDMSLKKLFLGIRKKKGKNGKYRCPVCSKIFSKVIYLQRHGRIHTGEKPFLCTVCGKEFSSSSALQRHCRIHSGIRPFPCTICDKSFLQKCDLQIHMRTHSGDRPFKCDTCQKDFITLSHLQRHNRTHTGARPFECSTCKKCFKTSTNLQVHLKIHTGEKPYKCRYCEKSFADPSTHSKHLKIHTGEMNHECSKCGRKFIQGSQLRIHMRTHTGERPYACSVCGKRFVQAGHVRIHFKTHSEQSGIVSMQETVVLEDVKDDVVA